MKNGGDNTLDTIFNLVEEAYNNANKGALLDSIFQRWNIVFVMFWVVRGYGGSQENGPGDQKKYDDGKLSMIIVANIYNALIISIPKGVKLMRLLLLLLKKI